MKHSNERKVHFAIGFLESLISQITFNQLSDKQIFELLQDLLKEMQAKDVDKRSN